MQLLSCGRGTMVLGDCILPAHCRQLRRSRVLSDSSARPTLEVVGPSAWKGERPVNWKEQGSTEKLLGMHRLSRDGRCGRAGLGRQWVACLVPQFRSRAHVDSMTCSCGKNQQCLYTRIGLFGWKCSSKSSLYVQSRCVLV